MRKLFLILMTLVACTLGLQAQTKTIHGTVLDASNGEPLIGATVMPIGGGQGAAADIDGNFTLSVPSGVKKAKVSYVGFHEQTVDLHDGMVVKLISDAKMLDETIVVAYGTANKESLTGSVAVVGSKEIEDRPVTSVTAALEGNAPGVQVNNSTGTPGSAPSIRIRGFNSFSSSAQSPLYVVDGVVFQGSISDINPADVESMSVLKDAASCALYGNKGANGVILITTKKAKNSGNVDVTATVRIGAYNRALPFYEKLGASQWMETSLQAAANTYVTKNEGISYQDAIMKIKDTFITSFCQNTNIFNVPDNELFDDQGKLLGTVLPGYTDLDWWDVLSRNGFRSEYSINAAAATEKFNVFSSASYLKENGYTLKTDFERFTGRINANFNPVSFFRTGFNLNASYSKSQAPDIQDLGAVNNVFLYEFYAPIAPYYSHADDETGSILRGEDGEPIWNTSSINKGDNIAWATRLDQSGYTTAMIDASLYGTAVLPYGFELTVRGSIYRTKADGMDYMNNLVSSAKGIGSITESWQNERSHTFMQTLNWAQDYGLNHVDVMLDHENFHYGYNTAYVSKNNQSLPDIYALVNFKETTASYETIAALATESYLGRVRYNYDQKYFGEVSLRRDGSSKFHKDNRWGTFWSVGGSWIISREKFMHAAPWVNYLKLRAAYGSVGNDLAAGYYSYMYLSSFNTNGDLIPSQLGSENLKWEATKTLDVALEGSLFNDRLNFSIGYFNKRNSDLIFSLNKPMSSGTLGGSGATPSILANVGTMENQGWEIQLGYNIIDNASFKWNVSADATILKNKIVNLPNGRNIVEQARFIGASIYECYDYDWVGIDQTNGRSLYAIDKSSPDFYVYNDDGDFVFSQSAYDEKVTAAKLNNSYLELDGKAYTYDTNYAGRKKLGTALPSVYGSFGTNLSWKGINLGLLFTYSLGGKTFNSNYQSLMSTDASNPSAMHKDILKSWTSAPAGVTPHEVKTETIGESNTVYTTYIMKSGDIDPNGTPQINNDYSSLNNANSSRWYISNNYLVFKNINVSYDLPKKWTDAMKLKGINIGFLMDNVFIAARQKGLNPQYNFSGGQGAYYVPARSYSFQLSVKF